MTATSTVTTVIKSTPYLAQMSLSLFWMYISLGRRVNKTRKAFEEQLTREGMSREDARRLSLCFEDLKNNITDAMKQGIRFGRD
jgi:hypothetical protein